MDKGGGGPRLVLEVRFDEATSQLDCSVSSVSNVPDLNTGCLAVSIRPSHEAGNTYMSFRSPPAKISDLLVEHTFQLASILQQGQASPLRLFVELWSERGSQERFIGGMSFSMAEVTATRPPSGCYFLLDRPQSETENSPKVKTLWSDSSLDTGRRIRSWHEHVAPSIYESLPKEERLRQEAINELIETEIAYRDDLESVLVAFPAAQVQPAAQLTSSEYAQIFGGLRVLHDVANKVIRDLSSLRDPETAQVHNVGDAIAMCLPRLEPVYADFCESSQEVSALIEAKMKLSPAFVRVLEDAKARCGNMTLDSYRLKPLQRITRYPLLLKEIDKRTPPGHDDKQAIASACEMMVAVTNRINEKVRGAEHRQQLSTLRRKAEVPREWGCFDYDIAPPGFRLVHSIIFAVARGKKAKKSEPRRLCLLEDDGTSMCYLLILCPQGDAEVLIYPRIPLETVQVVAESDPTTLQVSFATPWNWEQGDSQQLFVRGSSASECQAWLHTFQALKQYAQNYPPKLGQRCDALSDTQVQATIQIGQRLATQTAPLTETEIKLVHAARQVELLLQHCRDREQYFEQQQMRAKRHMSVMVESMRASPSTVQSSGNGSVVGTPTMLRSFFSGSDDAAGDGLQRVSSLRRTSAPATPLDSVASTAKPATALSQHPQQHRSHSVEPSVTADAARRDSNASQQGQELGSNGYHGYNGFAGGQVLVTQMVPETSSTSSTLTSTSASLPPAALVEATWTHVEYQPVSFVERSQSQPPTTVARADTGSSVLRSSSQPPPQTPMTEPPATPSRVNGPRREDEWPQQPQQWQNGVAQEAVAAQSLGWMQQQIQRQQQQQQQQQQGWAPTPQRAARESSSWAASASAAQYLPQTPQRGGADQQAQWPQTPKAQQMKTQQQPQTPQTPRYYFPAPASQYGTPQRTQTQQQAYGQPHLAHRAATYTNGASTPGTATGQWNFPVRQGTSVAASPAPQQYGGYYQPPTTASRHSSTPTSPQHDARARPPMLTSEQWESAEGSVV